MQNRFEEAEAILTERFGHDQVLALATTAGERPAVRSVNAYYEDGAFYVLTSALSNKMRQIAQNPNVAIAGEWFTANGTGESLGAFGSPDNARIAEKMRTVFSSWIYNGHSDLADAATCILRIVLTDGVLLSHGTRYEIDFTGKRA